MGEKKPLISVLLLSYNHENFIERSIRSVFALQSRDYDLELRIIDDGSSDNTQEIIKKLKVISPIKMYITFKEHVGIKAISSNFNELIFSAKGEYIAFLASDDFFIDNAFSKKIDLLEKDTNLKFVYSNGMNKSSDGTETEVVDKNMKEVLESNSASTVYNYITTKIPQLYIQALLVRSSFLRRVGGFDNDLIADDWVLNIKMFKYLYEIDGKYIFLDEIGFIYNVHTTNTSRNIYQQSERVIQVVDRYFEGTNRVNLMADLLWSYGREFIKDKQAVLGFKYLLKSQTVRFDLDKRIIKKVKAYGQ